MTAAEGTPPWRICNKIVKNLTEPLCPGEAPRQETIIHCLMHTFVKRYLEGIATEIKPVFRDVRLSS